MTSNFFADYLAAWQSLDVDAVMSYFTDDIVFEDTTLGHGARGSQAMRTFVRASFTNLPGATFQYVRHHSTGTEFACEWVMQPMNVRGVSVGRLRDGKICEQRDYWNGAAPT